MFRHSRLYLLALGFAALHCGEATDATDEMHLETRVSALSHGGVSSAEQAPEPDAWERSKRDASEGDDSSGEDAGVALFERPLDDFDQEENGPSAEG